MDKFVMKYSDDSVYMEAGTVEELAKALKTCPIGCVSFHLRGGLNDFGEWVGKAAGDAGLAAKLKQVKLSESNPESTRKALLELLEPKSIFKIRKKR